MKGKIHIIFALSAIAAAGCSRAEVETPQTDLQDIRLECRVDDAISAASATPSAVTKAHISDGVKSLWDKDDRISVFDAVGQNRMFSCEEGGESVAFSGQAVSSAAWRAIYPYNESAALTTSGAIVSELPRFQTALAGSFPKDAVILYGESSSNSLIFRPVNALLKFTLPEGTASVKFEAIDGKTVAGGYVYDSQNNTIGPDGTGYDNVILSGDASKALEAGKTYYMSVLPFEFANGIRLTLTGAGANAGKTIVREKTSAVVFKGGVIYDMGDITGDWDAEAGNGIAADFKRGVNLAGCFEVGQNYNADNIWMGHINDTHFSFLSSIGVDVVRIPMQLGYFVENTSTYKLQQSFFNRLDEAIALAEKYGMHIIIDNHIWGWFDKQADPEAAFKTIWLQIAEHCKNMSTKVVYELFNEPDGNYWHEQWHEVQGRLIEAVRTVDKKHTIIVTPTNYKTIADMPEYFDKNIIYTSHFYEPFVFSHQGGSWTRLRTIGGMLSFPYNPATDDIAAAAQKVRDIDASSPEIAWVNEYPTTGTVENVHNLLKKDLDEVARRGSRLYIGEFGTTKFSASESRCNWLRTVASYCRQNGAAYTVWTYAGDFGMFTHDGVNLNLPGDLDRNVAEALGFGDKQDKTVPGSVADFAVVPFEW